jgi:hypothetical protein
MIPAKAHPQATKPHHTLSPSKTVESTSPSQQAQCKAKASRSTALSLAVPNSGGSRNRCEKSHHILSAAWTAMGMRSPRRSASEFRRSRSRRRGWSAREKRHRLDEGVERASRLSVAFLRSQIRDGMVLSDPVFRQLCVRF